MGPSGGVVGPEEEIALRLLRAKMRPRRDVVFGPRSC